MTLTPRRVVAVIWLEGVLAMMPRLSWGGGPKTAQMNTQSRGGITPTINLKNPTSV